jgi:hypothetical protein
MDSELKTPDQRRDALLLRVLKAPPQPRPKRKPKKAKPASSQKPKKPL